MQVEEIRAVLLRTYQDTRDPDQRPYPEPGPVSADLMDKIIQLEIGHGLKHCLTDTVQWTEIKIRAGVVFIPVIVIRAEKRVPAKVRINKS